MLPTVRQEAVQIKSVYSDSHKCHGCQTPTQFFGGFFLLYQLSALPAWSHHRFTMTTPIDCLIAAANEWILHWCTSLSLDSQKFTWGLLTRVPGAITGSHCITKPPVIVLRWINLLQLGGFIHCSQPRLFTDATVWSKQKTKIESSSATVTVSAVSPCAMCCLCRCCRAAPSSFGVNPGVDLLRSARSTWATSERAPWPAEQRRASLTPRTSQMRWATAAG